MSGSIFRSVGIVSFLSLIQLATQFALQMILAERFGASATMDAFNAALTIPSTLNAILTISLGYVIIPTLSTHFLVDRDSVHGWRLAMAIGSWVGIASGIVSLTLFLFSRHWIAWLCPGFDGATRQIASDSLTILSWQLVFGAIVSWLNAVQNARSGFAWPAITALVGAAVNLVLAYFWLEHGILGYAWSVIVSSFVQTTLLMASDAKSMWNHWGTRHNELRMVFARWLPLLVGGTYVRLDPLVDRWIASFLDEGSIAHLGYAQRFIQALLSIATGGLLTVLFPKLASEDPKDPSKGLLDRMKRGMQGLTLVLVPIAMGGFCFAEGATRDLLERGQFLPADTQSVAMMFRVLLLMFVAASVSDWIARGHYSLGDTYTPTWTGVFGVSMGIVGKALFTKQFGAMAIVWSTSGYFLGNTLIMAYFLTRRIGSMVDRSLVKTLCRSVLAASIACVIAYFLASAIGRFGTLAAAPVCAIVYGTGLVIFREPIAIQAMRAIR